MIAPNTLGNGPLFTPNRTAAPISIVSIQRGQSSSPVINL